MTSFECPECGYGFESKSSERKKKCPYCGGEKIRQPPAAEDLLNEGN